MLDKLTEYTQIIKKEVIKKYTVEQDQQIS